MTHELQQIVEHFIELKKGGLNAVLVTVVDLEGSSYRKPGVRMLLDEKGRMTGAISGGCVEKEVARQAQKVFETQSPLLMTYDGRYRLGCEGILYILIEPFHLEEELILQFNRAWEQRISFEIVSYFDKKESIQPTAGSVVQFKEGSYSLNHRIEQPSHYEKSFQQFFPPCFQLIIIGAEHDAVQLCRLATTTGWEVSVVSQPNDPKEPHHFPEAKKVYCLSSEELHLHIKTDQQTAFILMTHNFAKDLSYLLSLNTTPSNYIGVLGSKKRNEKLLSSLLERIPMIEEEFLDKIHGPAGLNIGAITPQEIAISIISEILSIDRKQHAEVSKTSTSTFLH